MREGWKEVKLGDFIQTNKKNIDKNFLFHEIIYVDISSVGTGDISLNNIINFHNAPSRAKRLVSNGDTIISSVRPINKNFVYIKNPPNNLVVSTGFTTLHPIINLIDSRFLYFLISEQRFTDYLVSVEKGANYPAITSKDIEDYKFLLPPLETQRKIAKILSNYDDLIENNLKRIKILEEMAQQTYEEWFVRMRFPGYETATIDETTGLPEGWERGTLKRITKYLSGYAFKSALFKDKGNGVIRIKNIGNNTIDLSDVAYIDDEYASKQEKFLLEAGDLLIAMTGATIGKVGIMPESNFKFYLNQRVGKFITKNTAFLNCFFNSVYGNNQVINISGGAAQPNISAQQILDIELTVPSKEILQEFGSLFNNNIKIIINLQSQNQRLREARDILLPRLMMGLVDVDDIDL